MGKILVTGGAGYIGSHLVRSLASDGAEIVVFDDLSVGHRESLPEKAALYVGDLTSPGDCRKLFEEHRFDGIFHFGAVALVGESIEDPEKYYRINVDGGLNLLNAAVSFDVPGRFVFSSSCATYGIPDVSPIPEDCPRPAPINPYGWTKLFFERALSAYSAYFGFSTAFLRYFCAAGACETGEHGEDHDPETHLIPNVLKTALGQRDKLFIYGTDYPTRDGTAIRDYIHVDDLVSAHILAYEALDSSGKKNLVYNLGSERGSTVREIVEIAKRAAGRDFEVEEADRRPGDPPELVADSARIKRELGWRCEKPLDAIVESAFRWHERHPDGYGS